MAFEHLEARLSLDTSEFRAGIRDAQDDLGNLTQRAQSAGRSMQRAGAVMTAGITAPLTAIGVASLSTASDVEEMGTKSEAVFQDLQPEIEAWAETHADAVNRSALQLEEYAVSLADTFVPMGFARDEAAAMSKEVSELAIDLASFNNMAEDEALSKLESGLMGNHRALRDFGVAINQSTLEQELLNMGIEDGVQAASEQQKMLARMNVIMEATQDAQGDAARTSDSFANQMRGLRADTEELRAEIGQHLLPAATMLVGRLSAAAEVFGNLSNRQQQAIIVTGGLLAVVGPLLLMFGTMLAMLPAAAAGFGMLTGGAGAAAGALTAVSVAGLPVWAILLALGAAVAALAAVWRTNLFGIRNHAETAFGVIGELIDWLIDQINRIPGVDIDTDAARESIGDLRDDVGDAVPSMENDLDDLDAGGEDGLDLDGADLGSMGGDAGSDAGQEFGDSFTDSAVENIRLRDVEDRLDELQTEREELSSGLTTPEEQERLEEILPEIRELEDALDGADELADVNAEIVADIAEENADSDRRREEHLNKVLQHLDEEGSEPTEVEVQRSATSDGGGDGGTTRQDIVRELQAIKTGLETLDVDDELEALRDLLNDLGIDLTGRLTVDGDVATMEDVDARIIQAGERAENRGIR